MQASSIMKREIFTARREDTLAEAARRMREENIGFLPVVDSSGKPIGAVTDRDIVVRGVARELSTAARVADVMSQEVYAVGANDELERAERLMRQNQVARAMCVDDGGILVGVISLADIATIDSPDVAGDTFSAIVEREARI